MVDLISELPRHLMVSAGAVAFVAAVVAVVWAVVYAVRYVRADTNGRKVLRAAWRISRTWKRTARRVGLVQTERSRPRFWSSTPPTTVITRELVPAVKVRPERWGVRIDVGTLGRLGLKQFQDAVDHLADAWKVPQVRVEQVRPGVVRLRALLTDPLTEQTQWTDTTAADPGSWVAGIDADGQPVTIRSSGVSGVVVAGLAGYGKTSFLNARFCQLAGSAAVQFVLIDGKGGPDYDDLFARAWLCAKDDPQLVRDHLATVLELMTARQRRIRDVLGVKNMWHVGPSADWPLLVVIFDEAHVLQRDQGQRPGFSSAGRLGAGDDRIVEGLIRKGRNVGIQVIVATQKATADAIPTKIRDNCQVAVSFAQRTSEAATAILGSDITAAPDEHPRRLQDPAYVGVASMIAQGRPGFTLVRTPYVPDHIADEIARQTAHLVCDPLHLLTDRGRR